MSRNVSILQTAVDTCQYLIYNPNALILLTVISQSQSNETGFKLLLFYHWSEIDHFWSTEIGYLAEGGKSRGSIKVMFYLQSVSRI